MQKYFIPGGSSNTTRRLIKYGAISGKSCICQTDDENKVKKDSTDYNSLNVSNAQRIANSIQTQGYGGSVRFGTAYLGQQQTVNYLGRVEGQPGGSGRPPRNTFN